MNYRDVRDELLKMTDDELDQPATVHLVDIDEFHGIDIVGIAERETTKPREKVYMIVLASNYR